MYNIENSSYEEANGFIKKSWSKYKEKIYVHYRIVRSVRDKKTKQPKHEYLMDVMHLSEEEREVICAVLNGKRVMVVDEEWESRKGGGRV